MAGFDMEFICPVCRTTFTVTKEDLVVSENGRVRQYICKCGFVCYTERDRKEAV
jgi:C4-type Zn-finger protein